MEEQKQKMTIVTFQAELYYIILYIILYTRGPCDKKQKSLTRHAPLEFC